MVAPTERLFNYMNELIRTKLTEPPVDDKAGEDSKAKIEEDDSQIKKLRRVFNALQNSGIPSDGKELSDERLGDAVGTFVALDHDLQSLVMGYRDIASYPTMRNLANPVAVNTAAIDCLRELGKYDIIDKFKMRFTSTSAEEYLWEYVFQEIRLQCTPDELVKITTLANEVTGKIMHATASSAQKVAENALFVLSMLLRDWLVQVAIGLYVGWHVINLSSHVLVFVADTLIPTIVTKIVAIAPSIIIYVGALLYDVLSVLRPCALLGCVFSILITGYNSSISNIFKKIFFYAFLPLTLVEYPVVCGIRAYALSRRFSTELSDLSIQTGSKLSAFRVQRSLAQAQKIWVNEMIKPRMDDNDRRAIAKAFNESRPRAAT